MTPGLYLFHKPVGPTSFSIVQTCINDAKRRQPQKRPRICHGGTLDPFAHGLLLILTGPATRLFDHLHAIPKIYETTIRWGIETDNGDLLGQSSFTGDPSALSPAQLDSVLATFIGWHDQIPPATSNKRIDGERAYVKAHRGESVVLPPSRVYLHEARWISHNLPHESVLRITVAGGYYVRALARDLGRSVDCGAHLTALHRLAIGSYADPGSSGSPIQVPSSEILSWTPARQLSDQEVGDLRQERSIVRGALLPPAWPLPPGFPESNPPVRGVHRGRLVYLLRENQRYLEALREFPGGL